jgi:hypothetical protein
MTTRTTDQSPRERMTALAARQSLPVLCESLLLLDAKPRPDEAERLTRAVIIDSICERSPAADAAFQAWAGSDDCDPHAAARAIVAAVKGA